MPQPPWMVGLIGAARCRQPAFNDGVLEVRIEKKAEARPKQIQIGVGAKQLKGRVA